MAPNVRRRTQDYPIVTRDENTLMWNGVGGSSVVYTGAWPRYRPSDFRKGTEHGLAPDMPAAVVDHGTRRAQRVVTGTVADIAEKASAAALKGPAIIIVGTVVSLRDKLAWYEPSAGSGGTE